MAQFGRPSTDTTRDNWEEDDGTTTSIFDQIDETSADNADFIRTVLTPTNDVYVTKLTSVVDPCPLLGISSAITTGKMPQAETRLT